MVKISFKPWEEVVIHETIEYKVGELVRNRVIGLREGSITPALVWADGVLFSRSVMPATDNIVREQLKGIIHLSAVEWALMPRYRSNLRSGGVTIPIIDVSGNETLREVASELKKKHTKKYKRMRVSSREYTK